MISEIAFLTITLWLLRCRARVILEQLGGNNVFYEFQRSWKCWFNSKFLSCARTWAWAIVHVLVFLSCGCTSSARRHMLSVLKILTEPERISLCFICLVRSLPLVLCHGRRRLLTEEVVCLQTLLSLSASPEPPLLYCCVKSRGEVAQDVGLHKSAVCGRWTFKCICLISKQTPELNY